MDLLQKQKETHTHGMRCGILKKKNDSFPFVCEEMSKKPNQKDRLHELFIDIPPPAKSLLFTFQKNKRKIIFSSDEVQNDKGLLLLTGF